jgi:putative drug exporter of the RND superfamily
MDRAREQVRQRKVRDVNVAGRMGRWSAAHWRTATFGWLIFVVLALVAASTVGTRKLSAAEQAQDGSARADAILARGGVQPRAAESVLVRSKSTRPGSPAFSATVHDLVAALRRMPEVARVRGTAVSRDGRSELVSFEVAGKAGNASSRIAPVLDRVAAVERAHRAFTLQEVGAAGANKTANDVISQDLRRAEVTSVPVTFAILLFVFGAFVAAGLPVLLALSAVLATIGLDAIVSHVIHASSTTSSVVALMGMAVGVDYSLFYLRREREERARGRRPRDALHAAAASSGRAVLISGFTVIVALAGLALAGSNDFVSMAFGAILVVLVAMVGSLTVLPALLGRLEDDVDRGILAVLAAALMRLIRRRPHALVRLRDRRTVLKRLKNGTGESRLWGIVLRPALRFPFAAGLAAVAALVVVALPASGMRTANPKFDALPQDLPVVKAFDAVQRSFPGTPAPAMVVVSAHDVTTPAVRRGIAELRRQALATGQMHGPIRETVSPAHTIARVDIPLAGNGDDAASFAALDTLRSKVIRKRSVPSLASRRRSAVTPRPRPTSGTRWTPARPMSSVSYCWFRSYSCS